MPATCNVSGDIAALPGMSAQSICDRFTQDFAAALGEGASVSNIAVALTLHRRGAIEARISARHDGRATTYPSIAVDVLDRTLQPDDLTRLARAAAQVLNDSAAAPTAQNKDD